MTTRLPEIPSPTQNGSPTDAVEDFVMISSMDQQRWWALDALAPDNPALNVPFAVELRGPLNVDALEKALKAVILRHEALRTSFAWLEGEVKQVISLDVPFQLHRKDLSAEPKSQRSEVLLREMYAEARLPLTLIKAPIMRACLAKLDEKDHILIFTLHHIVCDGWSNGVILREMGLYYQGFVEGKPVVLPELPIQYADYAMWQRDWMKTPDFDEQVTFWEKMLTGGAPMLDFPTDHPRKGGPGHKFPGYMENYLLPLALTDRVKRLCQDFDATLFMIFFATYATLLHRYTGQTRFVVGTSMANRPRPELEKLIGQFANPMMLRIDVEDEPTFRELMGRVRDMLLGAMSHQDVPLESILERIEIKSGAREKPAIQAIVMFQKDFLQQAQAGELEIRPLRWVSPGTVIELTLGIVERAEGICLHMEHNPELIETPTIRRFLHHFEKLLEAILENPDAAVSELSVLTEEERAKLWPPMRPEYTSINPEQVVRDLKSQLDLHFRTAANPSGALVEVPANARLVVLDRHLRLLPPGCPGHIHVGGIFSGQIPANALVSGPLDSSSPVSLLRTEFVARTKEDGTIVLLGQESDFAQINGFRVNLRYMKSLLLQHPDVSEAAVAVFQRPTGEAQLIGYVVPKPGTFPDEKDLRALLNGKINDFTLPAQFLKVPSLAKNSHGEVVTGLLPKPAAIAKPTDNQNLPLESILYQQLIEIWSDILRVPSVTIRDNFFELGGTSLQGFRMMVRVEKLCGCSLPLSLLLTGATIANLARHIIGANSDSAAPLVPVQPKGSRTPLFFLHGDWAGGGFYCSRLSRQLGEDQPFYALPPYHVGKPKLLSMEEMAAYHIKIIKGHTPHGPYLLGGYCIGATVAMEIARQLVKQGEKVAHLLLIDPPTPVPWLRWVWPLIDKVGNIMGWNLQKKIHAFDVTAVSFAFWLSRSSGSKFASVRRRLGLIRTENISPIETDQGGDPGDIEILKSMDYAVYFLAYRLYPSRNLTAPTTLYFPEDAVQSRLWLRRITQESKAKVGIEPLPGDHHTCITKHMDALVAKMKKTLDSLLILLRRTILRFRPRNDLRKILSKKLLYLALTSAGNQTNRPFQALVLSYKKALFCQGNAEMQLDRPQPSSGEHEDKAIFHPSKSLIRFGFGFLMALATTANLHAQQIPASQVGDNALPIQGGSQTSDTSDNSQSNNNNSQANDNSQNNGTSPGPAVPPTPLNPTGAPNTPLIPQLTTSPYTPLNGYSENQPTQNSTPLLYNTGAFNLSQVATNNALQQAYGLGATEGFSAEEGMSYSHPLFERLRLGPFDMKASVTTAVVSDDNLTANQGTSANGKLSDTSIGITPSVVLVYGDQEGQRAYASLLYAPTINRYFQHASENSTNENVGFSASYPFQRLSLNLSETYTEITGINQDINSRTTQQASVTQLGADYVLSDKLGLSSQLQEVVTAYENGAGLGDEITSLNNALAYQLTDKITLGPALDLGIEQPKGGRQQTFERGLITWNYLATDKITFSGNAGAEIRQPNSDNSASGGQSNGSNVSPVFSAGIGYNPFDSTKLSLSGYQNVQASSGSGSQTVTNLGVGFSATQRVLHRFYLGFSYFYSHSEYQASSGSSTAPLTGTANTNFATPIQTNGSHQDNFVYRPSISFSPTLWSSVGLYYQYQDNESTTAGAGYHDNQMGVSVSAQF